MYITINDIKGEKKIDLSYSIQNFDLSKEITVIRMLSDNVKYEILKLCAVMASQGPGPRRGPHGSYFRHKKDDSKWNLCRQRELLSILEGMVELSQFVVDDQVIKKNKLKGITEMIINLDEPNNSDNLEDGQPSSTLFMYHVTDDKDFTHFEPQTPQYRKLKNGDFTSLTLKITDQAGNVITDGPQVTIVLHIKCNPF